MVDLIPSCFTIPFSSWSVDHRQHNKVSKQLPVIEKKKNNTAAAAAAGKTCSGRFHSSLNTPQKKTVTIREIINIHARLLEQTAGCLDLKHCDNMRDHIAPYLIRLLSSSTCHFFFSFSLKKLANYREVRLIPTYWPLTNSEAVSFELCLKHLSLTPCYASHLLLTQWIKFLLYFRHQTHRFVLATFVTSAPDKRLCKHLGLFSARKGNVLARHMQTLIARLIILRLADLHGSRRPLTAA